MPPIFPCLMIRRRASTGRLIEPLFLSLAVWLSLFLGLSVSVSGWSSLRFRPSLFCFWKAFFPFLKFLPPFLVVIKSFSEWPFVLRCVAMVGLLNGGNPLFGVESSVPCKRKIDVWESEKCVVACAMSDAAWRNHTFCCVKGDVWRAKSYGFAMRLSWFCNALRLK